RWCFDGYDAKIAGDRESAIAALRRFTPPVVTLDLGLPPDPANGNTRELLLLKRPCRNCASRRFILVAA
ncbi:hypothetical protein QQ73_10760, partial [Candidatus Endoriftia persephone str. Guaymas]|nr:hypothetical protein [Candidatus Endoriftia persephone str. Guaymas]